MRNLDFRFGQIKKDSSPVINGFGCSSVCLYLLEVI